jgi:hypothetical protein
VKRERFKMESWPLNQIKFPKPVFRTFHMLGAVRHVENAKGAKVSTCKESNE